MVTDPVVYTDPDTWRDKFTCHSAVLSMFSELDERLNFDFSGGSRHHLGLG